MNLVISPIRVEIPEPFLFFIFAAAENHFRFLALSFNGSQNICPLITSGTIKRDMNN